MDNFDIIIKSDLIHYSVDTFYLMGYIVKGMQELSEKNNKLEKEILIIKSLIA